MTVPDEIFSKQNPNASARHIDGKIVDIGNADTENSLTKFDQKNQKEDHKKRPAKTVKPLEQHGQKYPHRHK